MIALVAELSDGRVTWAEAYAKHPQVRQKEDRQLPGAAAAADDA